eukprot:TRINITY_DN2315_c1_g1_i1.p1 TRINITY_DN2315_c1_g1~~TRINITY_DN2315_c1_g1_i1.p1  ORF type:complete len:213 (-),score=46.39 TRINITY_DN2315_c1_g1_i1:590-1228(-)
MVDFNFNLNVLFNQEINAVRSDLIPMGYRGNLNHSLVQQQVGCILDVMGEASSRAQGLKKQITSAARFRQTEGQTAYILIHREGNEGKGSVLGLLKVGHKKLFLMDQEGKANEMIPNCVLDFYVAESHQRSGLGKRLFEHMLAQENADPRFMAIDRPSVKFLSFLRKHYGLVNNIPQVNNYVIFSGFFKDRPVDCSPTPKKARIVMGKIQYV